jgi:hypothetical protein
MTERYSSVAQAEVEAALGKVVSLAGYRGLLRKKRRPKGGGGKVVGNKKSIPTTASPSPVATRRRNLAFRERDTGFEPATFSLGMCSGGVGRGSSR